MHAMGCSPTQRQRLLLVASLVVVLVCVITRSAGATRSAPGSGCHYCHATAVDSRITVVKEAVELLMARLPAGPSPKGPGH
jgi:hypothetical protein